MESTSINFKQSRDFGELFNATFSFITQEIKMLSKVLLYYAVVPLLLVSILRVLMSLEQQNMMDVMKENPSNPSAIMPSFMKFFTLMIPLSLASILSWTSISCSIYSYIKLYISRGRNGFTLNDVWPIFASNFFPILGISIIAGIIMFVGFMFCVLPGIFFMVSYSLIVMVYFNEGSSLSKTLSRSMQLVSNNWWLTFALIIVSYIIISVVSLLLSIPALIAGLKPMLTNFTDLSHLNDVTLSTPFIISTTVTNLLSSLFSVVPMVLLAFHYFSLIEQKEKTSLIDRIDQIAND